MIFLDAYPLVALLADEPPADEVEQLLRRRRCAVSVVNLAEAVDVAGRAHGLPPAGVRPAIDLLTSAGLELVAATAETAWRAAAIRQTYYAKRTRELSLADCFLLAAAAPGDEIATSDLPVAETARAESLRTIPLPDSTGRRPG